MQRSDTVAVLTPVDVGLPKDVAYAPEPRERPADGAALVCCAQPVGDLVLDL